MKIETPRILFTGMRGVFCSSMLKDLQIQQPAFMQIFREITKQMSVYLNLSNKNKAKNYRFKTEDQTADPIFTFPIRHGKEEKNRREDNPPAGSSITKPLADGRRSHVKPVASCFDINIQLRIICQIPELIREMIEGADIQNNPVKVSF